MSMRFRKNGTLEKLVGYLEIHEKWDNGKIQGTTGVNEILEQQDIRQIRANNGAFMKFNKNETFEKPGPTFVTMFRPTCTVTCRPTFTWATWLQLGPNLASTWRQLGFTLALYWPNWVPTWPNLAPTDKFDHN